MITEEMRIIWNEESMRRYDIYKSNEFETAIPASNNYEKNNDQRSDITPNIE